MSGVKFAVKSIPAVAAEVEMRLSMPAALELIVALTEHVNNADTPSDAMVALLGSLQDAYAGDLPNVNPDEAAAA